jgi:lon-related putative ATP-dependent protease
MVISSLQSDRLRVSIDDMVPGIQTSADLKPVEGIIGQDRAVRALEFGLDNKAQGFNIYVSGTAGTGKLSAVHHFLATLARNGDEPYDWCYVNNFQDAYYPSSLQLPKGRANGLKNDMGTFVKEARQSLIRVFESDEYAQQRDDIMGAVDDKRQAIFKKVTDRAEQEGFTIKQSMLGILALPVIDGKIVDEESFDKLAPEQKKDLGRKKKEIQDELNTMISRLRELERVANNEIQELEHEVAVFAIDPLVAELRSKYSGLDQVIKYFDDVRQDIIDHLFEFLKIKSTEATPVAGMSIPERKVDNYAVNILVDNSGADGVPLVVEQNPTYTNLFGKVEKESVMGTMYTDFTLIRSGSIHQANGGFLIIPVEEILRNLFSYESLKRALKTRQIEIEEPAEKLGFMTSKSLKPSSIPMDVQVILVGEPLIYYLLYQYDKDFRELFKVKADFDVNMELNEDNLTDFYRLLAKLCHTEPLLPFDRSGLIKMGEYSIRLAGAQDKLSTRFGEISDMVKESGFYATQRGSDHIAGEDVKKAVDERIYRSNLLQQKINEMIDEGSIFIDIDGERTGQINGLAVLQIGDTMFGKPNRITAVTSVGHKGILDIEREAELGGAIHTKGVLILNGYLSRMFGRNRPLSLTASIVFEQSYGEVDGDSASSTELYALLSSLSGIPVRQGIAVTGSVNQNGEVQPVGGINEKIEGFFEVCRIKGLSGKQGVMIPAANVRNLMLNEEVAEAVDDGKFHIWPVTTIDEGIEVLTGVKGGKRLDDGTFEKGSINYLVDQQFEMIAEKLKELANPERPE